jgi:hypothetical protein
MTGGQRSALMWAAIILVAAYLMGVNVGQVITSIIHAAQSIHNTNAH